MNAIWVAVFGAAGVLVRYGADRLWVREVGAFPWATFGVNVVGCFLAGFVQAAFSQRQVWGQPLSLLLLTGFCGGLTTFSAYALQNATLLAEKAPALAILNLAAGPLAGLAAVLAGQWLSRNFVA